MNLVAEFEERRIPNDKRMEQDAHLTLDGSDEGGDIIVLEGKAELLEEKATELNPPGYFAKYSSSIQGMGETAESLAQSYSQPIRISPTKFIARRE